MATNYIICAAGSGERFKNYFHKAKPLIKIKGRFLLEWSLESLPIYHDDNIIIITQKKDKVFKFCGEVLQKKYLNKIHWHTVDGLTRGQLETAYLAKDYLDMEKGITIFNCDTYFQSRSLLSSMDNKEIDGVIPCSLELGDAWSFCKVDSDNNVLDICEKERISDWASVGFYYFRDPHYFIEKSSFYLQNYNDKKEIYVAPFYKEYLQDYKKIVIDKVDLFRPMGTIDQISKYWQLEIPNLVKENKDSTLVVDLDNTITLDSSSEDYASKLPNMAVINKLREYAQRGHKIIIHTARRMDTCANNEAEVLANIGKVTLLWLEKHGVPFDGIKFGKPYAKNGFYIDDRAIRPKDFVEMEEEEINKLLI